MTAEPWSLPPLWRWARFDEVAKVASNLVGPTQYPDLPHIAPNHIESETGRLLPYSTVAADGVTSAKHGFRAGQVLYSKIRPYLAKVIVAEFDGLCSADIYPIDTDLEPRYLKWWMLTREFTRLAAGEQARTVLPKINVRGLNALPVPVAPAETQRRIVEILEDHLSRLDAAATLLRTAASRWSSLWQSVLEGQLTGAGIAGERRAHPGLADEGVDDGALARLPTGWGWTRLGDLADVVGGVTKDASRQSDPSFVERPYLRVANVQRGFLNLGTVTTIRVPEPTASKLQLVAGDVLLNEGGDRDKLGRGWVWEGQVDNCIHQNHVFRARVRDGSIDPYLLSWAANSIGGRWCERNGRQSVNLASISLSKIKLMPIPVPPLAEQPRIVDRLSSLSDSGLQLRAQVEAASKRGDALRRSLLAAAFGGGLTGMASELDEPVELAGV